MAFPLKQRCTLLCMILLLSAANYCYSQTYLSKATYFTTDDGMGNPTGACGYGQYGKTANGGQVFAASGRLYQNGAGCGACYLVKCKEEGLCRDGGVKVMATDSGEGPGTDFILSYRAYGKMAVPRMASLLYSLGVVDVEYRRISCHEAANLVIKIVEHSNYPWYLAVIPLKQGGANDILSIEVYEKASDTWTAMRRVYGAVFDFQNPPLGELKIRLSVNGSDGQKWVESDKAAIPKYWKAGITIKTDIQLN
nr:expansin-like B1 [Ipomoea trifida]